MKEKAITLIIKPTSECNFRCKYCYHADTGYGKGIMNNDTLERLIKLAQQEYDDVTYIWHGGEPLLCGINFFLNVIKLQKKYIKPLLKVKNNVQTNGSLLNKSFINLFKRHGFNVSISYDGPGNNNVLRMKSQETEESFLLARKMKMPISTLSVVHDINVDNIIEMYEYFKINNLPMKFNPIFKTYKDECSFSISAKRYTKSIIKLFEYWLEDQSAVMMDPISQYLSMIFYGHGKDCTYGSCLKHWLGISFKGDIYPCGRSYVEDYRIGTLNEIDKLSDVFNNSKFIKLMKQSIVRRSKCKAECKYYSVCLGGCNNNFLLEGDIESNGGFFCDATRTLLDYLNSRINIILNSESSLSIYNPILKNMIVRKKISGIY